jgi:hypothetical protein
LIATLPELESDDFTGHFKILKHSTTSVRTKMGEVVDLSEYFAKGQCHCLNQSPDHPFTNLFVGDETLFLQSDVDGEPIVVGISSLSTRAIIDQYYLSDNCKDPLA